LVREFGEERINHMVIDKAIESIYRNALRQENIIPAAQ
jgi:hypothetical protein